jgi:hypothetical protein
MSRELRYGIYLPRHTRLQGRDVIRWFTFSTASMKTRCAGVPAGKPT